MTTFLPVDTPLTSGSGGDMVRDRETMQEQGCEGGGGAITHSATRLCDDEEGFDGGVHLACAR